ncbi:hypothetical protein BH11PLA2_BH11PLA2_05380 [soil metagenome]
MRKFVKIAAVAAVMSVGFVASVPAQDEPKKGRPTQPGQPGRGGFAGNMMMGTNVYGMLATNKVLQDELKITDDQKKKLEELSKAQMTKFQEAMKGMTRDATDEQRKEMTEKMTKMRAESKKAYSEVLTPEQAKRAQQISYQAQGLRAFSDAEVQTALKLSDEQKEKIKTVMEQYTKDSMELRGGGRGGAAGGGRPSEEDLKKMADNAKKVKALGDEAKEKIASGLSDEQKKSWKEMVGAEFDVTKLQQGFGGRTRQDS